MDRSKNLILGEDFIKSLRQLKRGNNDLPSGSEVPQDKIENGHLQFHLPQAPKTMGRASGHGPLAANHWAYMKGLQKNVLGNESISVRLPSTATSVSRKRELFYKVQNHHELFKLGNTYLTDLKMGIKSFAFSGAGQENVGQKTVFGVAAFLNYSTDKNITIVTSKYDDSLYQHNLGEMSHVAKNIADLEYDSVCMEGVEIVTFDALHGIIKRLAEQGISQFCDEREVILWDLPIIERVMQTPELYFPIIRKLDSISFVVNANKSKMKSLNKLVYYYKKYEVPLKGILLERS